MDINLLIDKLEEIGTNGKRIPMTGLIAISEQDLFDIVDEMRANMPEELKNAKWIIKEKNEIVSEAEKDAKKYLEEAKRKSEEMVTETEVYKLAEQKANEVIEEARVKEREIRLGAEDYADEMLANLEVNLGKLLTAVQRGRDRLQGKTEAR